ncbi:hypothetical protein GCM10009075_37270 [Sphingomonas trueperi]
MSVSLPGLEPALATKLAEEADQISPYSHRAREEIRVGIADRRDPLPPVATPFSLLPLPSRRTRRGSR